MKNSGATGAAKSLHTTASTYSNPLAFYNLQSGTISGNSNCVSKL